jgi:hypothetical protein
MNTDASRNGSFPALAHAAASKRERRTPTADSSFTTLPQATLPTLLAQRVARGGAPEKMAAPCGTAKFREETSKKADSVTMGHIAAVHKLDG